MASIIEALQNASYNLDNISKMGLVMIPFVKDQLNNGIELLEKGYDLYDSDVESLIEKYGSLESVPDISKD